MTMRTLLITAMILSSLYAKAEGDHYLYEVEKWASIYLIEEQRCPLDTITLNNGRTLEVFSNDYKPYKEAYDVFTLYLNKSFRSYENREECIEAWKNIRPVVKVLSSTDYDGLCDEIFCLEFSREEYLNATDYLFDNF